MHRERTILIGNGPFRLVEREKSWIRLLDDLFERCKLTRDPNIPLPIAFDLLVAALDNNLNRYRSYYKNLQGLDDRFLQALDHAEGPRTGLKYFMADWFNERGTAMDDSRLVSYIEAVKRLRPSKVLTTNYDLRLERILPDNMHVIHCHGGIKRPKTICIGLSDYLDSINSIRTCLQEIKTEASSHWPLHFINTDLIISGFSCDFQELDFWTLLNIRADFYANKQDEANRIIYLDLTASGDTARDSSKIKAMRQLGVTVIPVTVSDNDYSDAYIKSIEYATDALTGAWPY